jgi:CHAT domain-containing protein
VPLSLPFSGRALYWRDEVAQATARGDEVVAITALSRLCFLEPPLGAVPAGGSACAQARSRARAQGRRDLEALVLANQGNAHLWWGDQAGAQRLLDAALALAPPGSTARGLAEITLSEVGLERGDFEAALASSQRGIAVARALSDVELEAWGEIWRARVLAFLGATGRAAAAARRGGELAESIGDGLAGGAALWMLGLASSEAGDHEAALSASLACQPRAVAFENWFVAWVCQLNAADAEISLGRLEEAKAGLDALDQVVATGLTPAPFPVAVAEVRGRLLLAAGDAPAAAAAFSRVVEQAPVAWLAEQGRLGLARARAAAGDEVGAIAAYREGIAAVERAKRDAPLEELRAHFFAVRADVYRELAALLVKHGGTGAAAAAFEVAEAGRARALADARAAAHAQGEVPRRLTAAEAASRLGPSRAVVEYVSTKTETLALLIVGGRPVEAVALPAAGGAGLLAERVDFFRQRVREAESAGEIVAVGRRLYADLLAPVVARLPASVEVLLVAPDGPLHRLPFDALVVDGAKDAGRFVAERFVVVLVPSAAMALGEPAVEDARGEALVLTYDGAGQSSTDRGAPRSRLRFAAEEGRRVARAVGRPATLIAETAATKARLHAAGPGRFAVLHLATHAVVNASVPSRSALLLAAAPGGDGWLSAGDIFHWRLRPSLVVLSACDSGEGPVAGGEGPLSLARAFLEAGATAVAATFWELDDEAAVPLIEDFYRHVADGSTAERALTAVQRRAIARGGRPAVWAAFGLWGAPGFRAPAPRRAAGAWLGAAALAMGAAGFLVVRRRRATRRAAPEHRPLRDS